MKTENTYIIHPETPEQEKAIKAFFNALNIKFEIAKEKIHYESDFVKKIKESRKQAIEGKTVKMNLDDIWKE